MMFRHKKNKTVTRMTFFTKQPINFSVLKQNEKP